MIQKDEKLSRRQWYVILAACGLIGSCLGLGVNSAGLFFTAVSEDLGCGTGAASASLTIYSLMHAFLGMASGAASQKFGFKQLVWFGTVLQVLSTFLLSYCSSISGIWVFNALRGAAAGLIGTVFVTLVINRWFYKNNALVTSIAIGFSGLAGAVLSPLFSEVIVTFGWRYGYRLMAGIALLFHLPALLLPISLSPEERGEKAYGEAVLIKEKSSDKEENVSKPLFVLVVLFGMAVSGVSAFASHFAPLAESVHLARTGALMVSACMVSNTLGKVLLGKWMDESGVKLPVSSFCALIAVSSLFLLLVQNPIVMTLSAGVYGLCFSLSTVAIAVMTKDLFGRNRYGQLYPLAALASTIAHAVFTVLYGLFFDVGKTYVSSLFTVLFLITSALVMCLCAYRKKREPGSLLRK